VTRTTPPRLGSVLRALAAVLAGNALYFAVLLPRLPDALRHRPFALDPGLALDLVICACVWTLLAAAARRR
jgi:hypothetical protein